MRGRDAGGRRGHYGRELARLVAARLLRRAGGDATVVVVFESDGYQSHARHDAGASVRPRPPRPLRPRPPRGRRCASSRGGAADRDAEDVNGSLDQLLPLRLCGGGSSAGGDDHPRPRERRPARHGQREGILRLRRCDHRARRRPPPTAKATIKMPTALRGVRQTLILPLRPADEGGGGPHRAEQSRRWPAR